MKRKFKSQSQSELIRSTNMQVAKQAVKYVYGSDKSELEFVDKHISTDRPKCFSKGCASIESRNMRHPGLDRHERTSELASEMPDLNTRPAPASKDDALPVGRSIGLTLGGNHCGYDFYRSRPPRFFAP
jgi:hypothetical protein